MYNGGSADAVAVGGAVLDDSKYSLSKNPSTGQYYILHILNVGESDVQKYRCQTNVNGMNQNFYLKLDFLGRCNYTLVILKMLLFLVI